MNIGCHVSIQGGIQNAPKRAADLGCEVMQLFTRPPQGGSAPKLTSEIIKEFKLKTKNYLPADKAGKLKTIYIHAPYYINFASANNRIRYGSASIIREELERGSSIGAKYVMTHIGSAKEYGQTEAMKKVVEMMKKSLESYRGSAKLLFENSAGAGEIIGDNLSELAEIIKSINNPAIAGICLDTQHSFASGYDWNDFENTLKRIDSEIGIRNIKLIHANNSQTDLGSKRDRHEHIGKGKIEPQAFQKIVDFAKKYDIDMICETEYPEVEEDIKILKKMRDK
jgi:deoxyribonuclease IV